MIWIPVLFLTYLVLLGFLLFVAMDDERKKHRYTAAKMLVSSFFVVCYLVFWFGTASTASARPAVWALLLPLLCCWLGDLMLGLYQQRFPRGRRLKRFMAAGIAAFAAAHVLFLLYLEWYALPWNLFEVMVVAIAVATAITLSLLFHMRMGKLRIPVFVYAGLVALLMARGIRLQTALGGTAASLGRGTIYFFISDFLLLFLYFYPFRQKKIKKIVHAANLITYYLAVFGMILGAVLT